MKLGPDSYLNRRLIYTADISSLWVPVDTESTDTNLQRFAVTLSTKGQLHQPVQNLPKRNTPDRQNLIFAIFLQ
jgi:hypothetical protein